MIIPLQVKDVASSVPDPRKWHSSHGLDINDAMLAATVKNTGGKIYTLNVKHYPMSDLVVLKAWK